MDDLNSENTKINFRIVWIQELQVEEQQQQKKSEFIDILIMI